MQEEIPLVWIPDFRNQRTLKTKTTTDQHAFAISSGVLF